MERDFSFVVNGRAEQVAVPDRMTLADALRDKLGRTGTKLGCEQGVCGACTVLLDGASARSCLVLAGQADGSDVVTVEGLGEVSPAGRALQEAFERHDALQCGFCTPGFLIASIELLAEEKLDDATVREALTGNLCRCTGYDGIIRAVLEVHDQLGPTPLAAKPAARSQLRVTEAPPPKPTAGPSDRQPVQQPAQQPARKEPPRAAAPLSGKGVGAVVAIVVAVVAALAWRRWRSRPLTLTYVLCPTCAWPRPGAAATPCRHPTERR